MKAVIFDVVSVLIGWQPWTVYRKWVRDPELEKWFLDEVCRAPWDDRPVREGAFEEGLARFPAGRERMVVWFAKHHDSMLRSMAGPDASRMMTLLERLAGQGVQLWGVTDLRGEALTRAREIYAAMLGRLDGIVLDGEGGRSFEKVLRCIGLPPEQCFYVDESEANVRTAQSAGIPALRHQHVGILRRELRDRGFLPPLPRRLAGG